MTPGQTMQARVTRMIARYGESVMLSSGGATRTVQGVFEHAGSETIQTFFDDNEAVGLVKPALALSLDATVSGTMTPPTTSPATGARIRCAKWAITGSAARSSC